MTADPGGNTNPIPPQSLPMQPVSPAVRQQAIEWAWRYFGNTPAIADSPDERGAFLWLDPSTGHVDPEDPTEGDGKTIHLYAWDRLANVIRAWTDGNISLFAGDYHTHPRGTYYPEDLPSHYDVFETSALCDWCDVPPGTRYLLDIWLRRNNFEHLVSMDAFPFSPRIQLIQPARLGDVIVIEPVVPRDRFPNIATQKRDLAAMQTEYKNLLHRHGALGSIRAETSEYRGVMQGAVAEVNRIIRSRATMTYVLRPDA